MDSCQLETNVQRQGHTLACCETLQLARQATATATAKPILRGLQLSYGARLLR